MVCIKSELWNIVKKSKGAWVRFESRTKGEISHLKRMGDIPSNWERSQVSVTDVEWVFLNLSNSNDKPFFICK